MTHKPLIVIAASIMLLVSACECEHHQCPSFENVGDLTWLLPTDSVVFRNPASSNEISLGVINNNFTQSYGEDETVLSFTCKGNDCFAAGTMEAHTTTTGSISSMPLTINMNIDFEGKTPINSRLSYTLGTMSSSFEIIPGAQVNRTQPSGDWMADSIRSVNTGTSIYPDVLIQTRKADNRDEVVKTYWYKSIGLIGFAFQDGSVYWRI